MILVSTLLSLASFASPLLLQEADERTMVLYDVTDLALTKRSDIDEASIPDRPRTPGSRGKVEDELESRRAEEYQALADVIHRHVPRPGAATSVTANGILGVHGTSAQHAWIEKFLARQRSDPTTFYTAEVRMVKLPADTAVELGMTKSPQVLDEERASTLLKTCMELEKADILFAPKLSLFNRRRAVISTIKQVAYVSRWERHENVAPDGRTILDPVVEFVREGITMTCRVTRVDEDLLDVDLQVEQTKIIDMPSEETEFGQTTEPLVVTRSMHTVLALQSGYAAVFSGLGAGDETMLIIVRVKIIVPEPRRDR